MGRLRMGVGWRALVWVLLLLEGVWKVRGGPPGDLEELIEAEMRQRVWSGAGAASPALLEFREPGGGEERDCGKMMADYSTKCAVPKAPPMPSVSAVPGKKKGRGGMGGASALGAAMGAGAAKKLLSDSPVKPGPVMSNSVGAVSLTDSCLTETQQQAVNTLREWEDTPATGECAASPQNKVAMMAWAITNKIWKTAGSMLWNATNGHSLFPGLVVDYKGPTSLTDCGGDKAVENARGKLVALHESLVDKKGIRSGLLRLFPGLVAQFGREAGEHVGVFELYTKMARMEANVCKFYRGQGCQLSESQEASRDAERARRLAGGDASEDPISKQLVHSFQLENGCSSPTSADFGQPEPESLQPSSS